MILAAACSVKEDRTFCPAWCVVYSDGYVADGLWIFAASFQGSYGPYDCYWVKLEGDEYAVHALDEYFQVDIEYSAFFKLAQKVEER